MMPLTAEQVLAELQHHRGEAAGIHVRDLVQRITGELQASEPLERRVRQLITELRMDGIPVCAHPSAGYYLASNPEELDATCNFLYARSMTGLAQIARMRHVAEPCLRGQLQLPAPPNDTTQPGATQ